MKFLLVGNANTKIDNIAAAQLNPFFKNRVQLRHQFNVTFQHRQAVTLAEIAQACQFIPPEIDVLFVRPDWRELPEAVTEVMQTIRTAYPHLKIFFIDPWDQVSSRFFGVLPYVDRLLKYQRLKRIEQYQLPLQGGTVITNYLASHQGIDLGGWHVGSEIDPAYLDRIATGWGVVSESRFETMLLKPLTWQLTHRQWRRKPKNIDVFCHVSYDSIAAEGSWYTQHRQIAIAAVQALAPKYRLAASGEFPESRTVSRQQYQDEIQRSRIVVSPFGWGEITWRDYEAVCNHALLLKPNIDHIETSPQIFYPGETYVPLKWDFSDLEEKCTYYLRNPDEAARIQTNARRLLTNYFQQHGFVKTIAQLLGETPIPAPAGAPVALPTSVTSPLG